MDSILHKTLTLGIKACQVSTTNSSFIDFNKQKVKLRMAYVNETQVVIFVVEDRPRRIRPENYRTSLIKHLSCKDRELTIYTRNSVYVFNEVDLPNFEEDFDSIIEAIDSGKVSLEELARSFV